MTRKLFTSGALKKNNGHASSESDGFQSEDIEIEDAIKWLGSNERTVDSVVDEWRRTSIARIRQLHGSYTTVHQYYDQFPVLKSPTASLLLQIDFEEHFKEADLKLYTEWPVLSCFILSKVSVKEKESVEELFTSDGKKAKTLRLLTSLFAVKTVHLKKKKQWRPSRMESRDGLIQYVKTRSDLQIALLEKKKKFSDLGIPHSQVFAVSLDEDTIDSCHIAVNQVWYNRDLDNPLHAFDAAFKAMHMLDSSYPLECSREMLFLQKAVYGFSTNEDKKLLDKSTLALIEEYNKFKGNK